MLGFVVTNLYFKSIQGVRNCRNKPLILIHSAVLGFVALSLYLNHFTVLEFLDMSLYLTALGFTKVNTSIYWRYIRKMADGRVCIPILINYYKNALHMRSHL